ncbi:hypothetical protein AAG906_039850 [Vitis piasezkii]
MLFSPLSFSASGLRGVDNWVCPSPLSLCLCLCLSVCLSLYASGLHGCVLGGVWELGIYSRFSNWKKEVALKMSKKTGFKEGNYPCSLLPAKVFGEELGLLFCLIKLIPMAPLPDDYTKRRDLKRLS